jgi:hypothetical protein
MWIPLGIGGLVVAGIMRKRAQQYGIMTPERQTFFVTAMANLKDPLKLNKLADGYDKVGLKEAAELLRGRAKVKSLPDDVKAKHRAALKKGLASKNVVGIIKLAEAFDKQHLTGSSKLLREHAAAISKADAVASVKPLTPDAKNIDLGDDASAVH